MRRPVERDVGRAPLFPTARSPLPFQNSHLVLEPAQIHVEPHRLRVSRLLGAEQIPRPPQLEIPQGDPVARPQIGMMLEHP